MVLVLVFVLIVRHVHLLGKWVNTKYFATRMPHRKINGSEDIVQNDSFKKDPSGIFPKEIFLKIHSFVFRFFHIAFKNDFRFTSKMFQKNLPHILIFAEMNRMIASI